MERTRISSWAGQGRARRADAVVVGGGHHGLVAATVLADAGWQVELFEARDQVGGAVASRQVDGWVLDEFSACHPLAVASPVLRALELEQHGLAWQHAPRPLAHVGQRQQRDGAALQDDPQATADGFADPRDARQWLRMVEQYHQVKQPLLDALLTQWPPTTSALRTLRALGGAEVLDFVRMALLPVDRMGIELFRGPEGRDLLAGNAMHADIPPQAPGSGLFGWLMTMLAQDVGFPSPRGGTAQLALALRARAEQAGVVVHTQEPVEAILTTGGRATGVRTAAGRTVRARRAVVADTSAPSLYRHLLDPDAVPAGLSARLERFAWDLPTIKLNYRLSAPMPWTASAAHGAGVVHVGLDHVGVGRWSADLDAGVAPEHVFALVGQMATIDPGRAPAGGESLWLYTHAPRGHADNETASQVASRAEAMLDDFAPGWRDAVVDRWTQFPADLHDSNDNLGDGAVGGGTMQLFQQAVWRPVTGFGGPGTHLAGLYLASAATHPGGGVHGGAGYLAARAALREQSWWGRPARRLRLAGLHRLYQDPPALH